ncbi:nickel-dependent hydrogenase large subunit [Escherichia coli]
MAQLHSTLGRIIGRTVHCSYRRISAAKPIQCTDHQYRQRRSHHLCETEHSRQRVSSKVLASSKRLRGTLSDLDGDQRRYHQQLPGVVPSTWNSGPEVSTTTSVLTSSRCGYTGC